MLFSLCSDCPPNPSLCLNFVEVLCDRVSCSQSDYWICQNISLVNLLYFQILAVNGIDFESIEHESVSFYVTFQPALISFLFQAVHLLKNSLQVHMTVRFFPYGNKLITISYP
jgi:hypothetical protein